MTEETTYFCYVLSKCNSKKISEILPKEYKNKREFVIAYENSSAHEENASFNNRRLVDYLNELLNNEKFPNENLLDCDAQHVLNRCREKIYSLHGNIAYEHDTLFAIISDYLWLAASVQCNNMDTNGKRIHLIEWPTKEIREIKKYLEKMLMEIENAKNDLEKMQVAKNLPLLKYVFSGFIDDDDVRYYANRANYTYSELEDQLISCKDYIAKYETLFYAFAVSLVLRSSLR